MATTVGAFGVVATRVAAAKRGAGPCERQAAAPATAVAAVTTDRRGSPK
ncbi:MAG: hypothetical protein LBU98_00435 [Alistipes sp.]|nr:hypothetical protein [Alistipes sp.]